MLSGTAGTTMSTLRGIFNGRHAVFQVKPCLIQLQEIGRLCPFARDTWACRAHQRLCTPEIEESASSDRSRKIQSHSSMVRRVLGEKRAHCCGESRRRRKGVREERIRRLPSGFREKCCYREFADDFCLIRRDRRLGDRRRD